MPGGALANKPALIPSPIPDTPRSTTASPGKVSGLTSDFEGKRVISNVKPGRGPMERGGCSVPGGTTPVGNAIT